MDYIWTVHGMIEVMDVVETGRRRRFSPEEKIRIVEESLAGPNLTRATARRYGIALSGLYLWRRQYRDGELGSGRPAFQAVDFASATALEPLPSPPPEPHTSNRIEVVLANGRRMFVPTDTDTDALVRFVQVMEQA